MRRVLFSAMTFAVSVSVTTGQAVVDFQGAGRTFDGVGAISGGGGNSRLLYDYPEPYRSEILDLLFKPGYGASLQLLKVEIGGDANSTSGAEPSHMHSANDENYDRGYEWWLMKEAKARNPNIKLAALEWTAPGWIGNGVNFWSQDNVEYIVKWIQGAKARHGLTIDYVGGWNECYTGWDLAWFSKLKRTLAAKGLPTKIIGVDEYWAHLSPSAQATISDSSFYTDIDVVGAHYPCDFGIVARCASFPTIPDLDKPLWSTESSDETGNIVRSTNLMYIDGRMTASLIWPMVGAIYRNFPLPDAGIIIAGEPWSGRYSVGQRLWATAHTTQFAQPGWRYVDSGVGRLGSGNSGSYVTLVSPNGHDYSIIVETLWSTVNRLFTFNVADESLNGQVHIWASNLFSSNWDDWFVRQDDITPVGTKYTLLLKPGYVYSITTTTGQGKGYLPTPPLRRGLTLPWTDDFDEYEIGRQARLVSDVSGAFEVQPCSAGRQGQCLRQMAPSPPYFWWVTPDWRKTGTPYTLVGDPNWTNYRVTVDFLFEQPGTVEVLGRVTDQNYGDPSRVKSYRLEIDDGGDWAIVRGHVDSDPMTLASGAAAPIGTRSWHTAALTFSGSNILAEIDGERVGMVNDPTYAAGQAGLGVKNWINVEFDDWRIEPLRPRSVRR